MTEFTLPKKSVDRDASVDERLTENVRENILPARYLNEDESPEEMFRRVANDIALAETNYDAEYTNYDEWAKEYYKQLSELRLMPNSPALMNMGDTLQMGAACFTDSPDDSMESIFQTAKEWGIVQKFGGGIGGSFGKLRPKGAPVRSTDGVSSGPVSFMKLFNEVAGTVKQGGVRRGAQMAILPAVHADIGRFAVCKREEGRLSNFNISVAYGDDFIDSIRNDEYYTFYDPETDYTEPQEVYWHTETFYDPSYRTNPAEPMGEGDGELVEENLWRDYGDSIKCLDEDGELVTLYEKWADEISLDEGDVMELPAQFIFDILVDGAWRNGEPGIYYVDEANRKHSSDVESFGDERYQYTTNPCFTGDTLISTSNGLQRAEELYEAGHSVDVTVSGELSNDTIQEASSVYKTGTKDVHEISTKEGHAIRLTEDHRVLTKDGWTEVQELNVGDSIRLQDREGGFGQHGSAELGRVLGWFAGDGHINTHDEQAILNFYDQDAELSEQFAADVNEVVREPMGTADYTIGVNDIDGRAPHRQQEGCIERRVQSSRLYELVEKLDMLERTVVPDEVLRGSREMAVGFLQALFTADGSIQGNKEKGFRVRLGSTDEEMLRDVQRLLLNFGIRSTIYDGRDGGTREMPDGKGGTKEYDCKKMYRLDVTSKSMQKFHEKIGFLRSDKTSDLEDALDTYTRGPYSKEFTATIENIEFDGTEDVYDLTEPNTNSLIGNGVVIHNCAEQMMEEYESCNLAHINLSLLVESDADFFNEYDGSVEEYFYDAVDLDNLNRTIRAGVRFLDGVVDRSEWPINQIDEKVSSKRKIGLGLMGFAQMCYQMGIEYGSEESFELARCVMRHIQHNSVQESHQLAKERGVFEDYENSKWSNPTEYAEWFERFTGLPADEHEDGFPVRNHSVTTIAPTGTTSRIANTSGGCEPVYDVAYFSNIGNDIQGSEYLVNFDDYFVQTLEANDIDVNEVKAEAKEQMSNDEWNGVAGLSTVPDEIADVFVTTQDVSPEGHVDIQRAFQEFCSSGISKTINLPSDATRNNVKSAYLRALDQDGVGTPAKGITVYRDKSREEQVLTTTAENDESVEVQEAIDLLEDAGYEVSK